MASEVIAIITVDDESEEYTLQEECSSDHLQLEELTAGTNQQVTPPAKGLAAKLAPHFTHNQTEKEYICIYCRQSFNEQKNHNTPFTLKRHLQRTHKLVYVKLFPPVTDTSATSSSQSRVRDYFQNVPKPMFSQEELEKRIVEFIVLTDQPFSIVDDPSFQNLFAFSANVEAKMIGRNAVRRRLDIMYDEERTDILRMISASTSKVSFVLDCWSANLIGYHGIIARWITDDWELKETILGLDILEGHHDGNKLSLSFMKVLEEFGLTTRICGVTTDNASNCDTFFTKLIELLNQKGIGFSEDDQRVRCLAHVLNLACQDAMTCLRTITTEDDFIGEDDDDENPDVLISTQLSTYSKLRTSVKKIMRSTLLDQSFKTQCEISKVKYKNLVADVKTRWNSTFYLLRRALKVQVARDNTLRKEKLNNLILSNQEWELVSNIVDFFKPFQKMTTLLSSNDGPNMSIATSAYLHLYAHLESISSESGHQDMLIEAAKEACAKLNKYYPKTDGLTYVIGTNPRVKLALYSKNPESFPSKVVQLYRKRVRNCWQDNYKLIQNEETTTETPVKKKKLSPSDFLSSETGVSLRTTKDELQKYLDQPPVSPQSESMKDGPLQWWKDQKDLPTLSRMAMDYLPISATGVPIERFFSGGSNLLVPKRRHMKDVTVKKCMCLKAWLKARKKDEYKQFMAHYMRRKILGD